MKVLSVFKKMRNIRLYKVATSKQITAHITFTCLDVIPNISERVIYSSYLIGVSKQQNNKKQNNKLEINLQPKNCI